MWPPIVAHRRGWVAEPLSRPDDADGSDGIETRAHPRPSFTRQPDGSWALALQIPKGVLGSDVALDVGEEQVRVTIAGEEPLSLAIPPGISSEEAASCAARFSRRRGELAITIPASAARLEDCRRASEEQSTLDSTPAVELADPSEACLGARHDKSVKQWMDAAKTTEVQASSEKFSAVPEIDPQALQMAGTWMLHSAAATGDTKRLSALLAAKADPNAEDESGATALEKACTSGMLEVAALLLRAGARASGFIGARSTPLHRSVAAGGLNGRKLVQLLVARGANRYARDRAGRTPAELARSMGMNPWPELE